MKVEFGTKKEYEAYAVKLEHIIDTEAAKPAGMRDDALIDECLETAVCCLNRAAECAEAHGEALPQADLLQAEAGRRLTKEKRWWCRKAVGVCAALLAVLTLICYVRPNARARAGEGPLLLSADVYWEDDYVELRYWDKTVWERATFDPNAVIEPTEIEGYSIPRTDYESEKALRERFGSRIPIPEMPEGYRLDEAFCWDNSAEVYFHLRYRKGMHKIRISGRFCTTPKEAYDGGLTVCIYDHCTDLYEKEINGAKCIFAIGEKRGCFVSAVKGGDWFRVSDVKDIETLEKIVYSMTKGD